MSRCPLLAFMIGPGPVEVFPGDPPPPPSVWLIASLSILSVVVRVMPSTGLLRKSRTRPACRRMARWIVLVANSLRYTWP